MYYVEKTQMQRNYIRWGEPTNLQSSKSWVYRDTNWEEEGKNTKKKTKNKKRTKPTRIVDQLKKN